MYGLTPLEVALHYSHIQVARHLLLGSTDELLAALSASRSTSLALPLYADLAASRPLTDEQWGQVPASCAPLARALPAVLARSRLEARLLMQRLVADQRQRLRTFALCLAQAQQRARVALPSRPHGAHAGYGWGRHLVIAHACSFLHSAPCQGHH